MDIKARLHNYGFWISLAATVLLVLQVSGVEVVPAEYNTVINSVLGLLVAAGVLNDPTTSSKGFGDDK